MRIITDLVSENARVGYCCTARRNSILAWQYSQHFTVIIFPLPCNVMNDAHNTCRKIRAIRLRHATPHLRDVQLNFPDIMQRHFRASAVLSHNIYFHADRAYLTLVYRCVYRATITHSFVSSICVSIFSVCVSIFANILARLLASRKY